MTMPAPRTGSRKYQKKSLSTAALPTMAKSHRPCEQGGDGDHDSAAGPTDQTREERGPTSALTCHDSLLPEYAGHAGVCLPSRAGIEHLS